MDMEKRISVENSGDVAERLDRHPEIKARLARLLDVMDNVSGDIRRADEAERRVIDEIRQMGLEAMQGWGQKTADEAALEMEARRGIVREVKKTPLGLHIRRSDCERTDLSGD